MPKGLKIKNRENTPLFNASWTTGVEYDERLFDEQMENVDHEENNEKYNEVMKDDEYDEEKYSSEDSLYEKFDEMDQNQLGDILEEQYLANENDEIDNKNKNGNEETDEHNNGNEETDEHNNGNEEIDENNNGNEETNENNNDNKETNKNDNGNEDDENQAPYRRRSD